jgi:hypothetical protein
MTCHLPTAMVLSKAEDHGKVPTSSSTSARFGVFRLDRLWKTEEEPNDSKDTIRTDGCIYRLSIDSEDAGFSRCVQLLEVEGRKGSVTERFIDDCVGRDDGSSCAMLIYEKPVSPTAFHPISCGEATWV